MTTTPPIRHIPMKWDRPKDRLNPQYLACATIALLMAVCLLIYLVLATLATGAASLF